MEKFAVKVKECWGVERVGVCVSLMANYSVTLECRSKEVFRRFMNGQTGYTIINVLGQYPLHYRQQNKTPRNKQKNHNSVSN